MSMILFEGHLQIPPSQVGTFNTSKIPVVRMKGLAAWLLVIDDLLSRPEPSTAPWDA